MALVGSAAHLAVDVAQAAVRVVVTAIQRVVRVGLSLAMGPAGVQQAVGSDFLNRLNKTPDTRPGVNYLVLGSKNDTTATPYESTFLKAGPGSAVFNVEEHSLPGAKPTDVIKHVDTPQPVVDAIVRFLIAADTNPTLIPRSTVRAASPQPKTAETPPSAPARTTSSIKEPQVTVRQSSKRSDKPSTRPPHPVAQRQCLQNPRRWRAQPKQIGRWPRESQFVSQRSNSCRPHNPDSTISRRRSHGRQRFARQFEP